MAYTIVARRKGTNEKFVRISPYFFKKKSDFGSMKKIKEGLDNLEVKIKKV